MSSVTVSAVTFKWVIAEWSKKSGVHRSETFSVGGYNWCVSEYRTVYRGEEFVPARYRSEELARPSRDTDRFPGPATCTPTQAVGGLPQRCAREWKAGRWVSVRVPEGPRRQRVTALRLEPAC
jgi:hypothetical protein